MSATATSTSAANRATLESLFNGDSFPSPEVEYELRSEDFTAEIPQTGEHFDSRAALRDMQSGMGTPPEVKLRRISGDGDFWVVESTQTYENSGDYYVCVIVEFEDGKIKKETRYYGPPLETDRA